MPEKVFLTSFISSSSFFIPLPILNFPALKPPSSGFKIDLTVSIAALVLYPRDIGP
ncbi:MAG: hypothetical protein ACFFG0_10175 [Candidatus Thorarchaeota archaeon]